MAYKFQTDEVVFYKGLVDSDGHKGTVQLTVTSQNLIFEQEKGLLKKTWETIDIIPLNTVKVYNGAAQVKQKGSVLDIQAVTKNLKITFEKTQEAKMTANKLIDVVTGMTRSQRGAEKVKHAIDMIDDTLGLDTRGIIKGVVEGGVKGIVLDGIKKMPIKQEKKKNTKKTTQ